MLHHVSVGVSDVEKAARFYDAALNALGYKRVMEFLPYAIGYGENAPEFWIQLPHNRQAASVGNGVHVSFVARTKDAVQKFHKAALEKGGTDDGAPGPRPDYGPDYYGAFVFDLDGNKVEATLHAVTAEGAAVPVAEAAGGRKKRKERRKRKQAKAAAGGNEKSKRKDKKKRAERRAARKAKKSA